MRYTCSIAGVIVFVSTFTMVPTGCMLDSTGQCEDGTCARNIDPCIPRGRAQAVPESCGIFVSSSRGDDGGAGSKDAPVKSLAMAIELSKEKTRNVYACAEGFQEAILVPSGMRIFGGLDCNDGWKHVGDQTKTTVAAASDAVPMTLLGGEGTTRVEDIVAKAASAGKPGGSSIAMIAKGTAYIAECNLIAQNGADGAAGTTPADPVGPIDASDPAIRGDNGLAGGQSGSSPGGAGRVNALCPESFGGDGGKGTPSAGTIGASGYPMLGGGLGGNPVDLGQNCLSAGGHGQPGFDGGPGLPGAGGTPGMSGQAGQPGKPAQGGGGGGGTLGFTSLSGASGGGGGAGGCGGKGGLGGQAGGSSIALLSRPDAKLTLVHVRLETGLGGKGGSGGLGQLGAIGGNGGSGGTGAPGSPDACSGGSGGQGGIGGKGGGGGGGNSIGIAYSGDAPLVDEKTSFHIPGQPSEGGTGEGNAGDGAAGFNVERQAMPASFGL